MNNTFFYEKIKDVIKLIDKLKSEVNKTDSKVLSINNDIVELKTVVKELKSKDITDEIAKLTSKLLEKTEKYQIKDGYWYYQDKKISKAIGLDGKDGLNGKDGKDFKFEDFTEEQLLKLKGKDGKNGRDGINGKDGIKGKDGIDGKDGKNGKDGEPIDLEIGKVETITSEEQAKVEITKDKNKYKIDFKIPKGMTVKGAQGLRGAPATINGLNTLNIVAGNNIELEQTEDNLTINGLNTLNIVAGDNITIDQEDDTLTINATATPQIQSDMSQEDDTQVDFVKNKHANYIKATLYEEGEEGEQIPVYEGTVEELLNIYLYMIGENYESLYEEIERKQDPLEDIPITIYYSSWVNKEATVYCNVSVDTKIWYSPTTDSYDDFVEAEIRMTEQGPGYVKFKCETTPEENIEVIIRRA